MIATVIIASGFSHRMGRSKLDLELGGRTFLQRVMDAATGAAGVGQTLVVVRPEDESQVQGFGSEANSDSATDNSEPRVEVMPNPRAVEGQSASIRLATERLTADPRCEAAIFAVVDQPFLTSEVFDRLIGAWRVGSGEILVSSYDGQRGNPVLFARRFFGDLLQLAGEVGGRDVIRRYPDAVHEVLMPDPLAGRDVDTWEEYQQISDLYRGVSR